MVLMMMIIIRVKYRAKKNNLNINTCEPPRDTLSPSINLSTLGGSGKPVEMKARCLVGMCRFLREYVEKMR